MSATSMLSQALSALGREPLPPSVASQAWRSLYNVVGTAVGASRSNGVETVLRFAGTHGGRPTAPIPGRRERADPLVAALAVGLAAHYDDYDDTHLQTVIHPGAATLAALLAVAEEWEATGREALTAFALGCEVQLRVGLALSPSHYDAGWHITGTCGVVGAAVTAGVLMRLGDEGLRNALGLAASQTLGLREAFGTHTKPFHPGKAASNGVLSALLAAEGMTAPVDALGASRGLQAVLSEEPVEKLVQQVEAIGEEWELKRNTFKPYPCGIVSHPCIDAAVRLHSRAASAEIERVTVRCHPLVVELTGDTDPWDGLQARFSTIHGVAAGLRDGSVGLAQYRDERVRAADLVTLRAVTRLEVDESLDRDAAAVEIVLANGQRYTEHVQHARGSLARPLTDDELDDKVEALVDPVLPGRVMVIKDAVQALEDAPDLRGLVAAFRPGNAPQ